MVEPTKSKVRSRVPLGKVRSTLGNGDAIKDAATEMRHKANELTSDVAERTEDAMADRAP